MWKLICFSFIPAVVAHSWVACTNYNPPSTDYDKLGDFDRSKCSGYPRNYKMQFEKELQTVFGIDTGYNWEHNVCRDSYQESDYSTMIPMAQYVPNTIVHISHPAKNHVADTCTNPFIPSASMKLMMSSQPNQDLFDISIPMVGADHSNGQIDYLGYQRCFNFCGNPDKAHCITSWQLPSVPVSGKYSFSWIWEFNPGQFYTNCFDAMVSSDGSVVPSSSSMSGSYSSSGSSDNETITFPPPTPAATKITPAATTDTPEPITDTPEPSTVTPESTTEVPATPEPSTVYPITSDATQLRSIFADLFKSIQITFNGTMNISSIFT